MQGKVWQCMPIQRNERLGLAMALAILTLGLVVTGVWTNLVGYTEYLLPDPNGTIADPYGADVFQLGRLLCGIVFIVFARHIPRRQNLIIAFIAPIMCMSTGLIVIAHHQSLVEPLLLANFGFFFASLGYCCLVWAMYLYFAQFATTLVAIWCVAAKIVIAAILTILINLYMLPTAQMILIIVAPLFCAICYAIGTYLLKQNKTEAIVPSTSKTESSDKFVLVMQLLVSSAALVCIKALSNIGVWGHARGNFAGVTDTSFLNLAIIPITIFLLTFLVFHLLARKLPMPLRSTIGLIVMLAGLQVLVLTDGQQLGNTYDLFFTAIEAFSHLVLWVTAIEGARSAHTLSYRVAGILWTSNAAIWLLWTHVIETLEIATGSFVMITIYVLLIVVIFTFFRSQMFNKPAQWIDSEDALKPDYLAFAGRRGLSPRESEIFVLLMLGRKRADIEKECKLSNSTVKTHIARIYKKLDVHSRNELRVLYEEDRSLGLLEKSLSESDNFRSN